MNEAGIEAVTGAGGIDSSEPDAGNVAALPVPYRSGACAAAFNDHGPQRQRARLRRPQP